MSERYEVRRVEGEDGGYEVWDHEKGERWNAWLRSDHPSLTDEEAQGYCERHCANLNAGKYAE